MCTAYTRYGTVPRTVSNDRRGTPSPVLLDRMIADQRTPTRGDTVLRAVLTRHSSGLSAHRSVRLIGVFSELSRVEPTTLDGRRGRESGERTRLIKLRTSSSHTTYYVVVYDIRARSVDASLRSCLCNLRLTKFVPYCTRYGCTYGAI